MMQWLLVTVIVTSTVLSDLLQTIEMKRVGEVEDFRPRGIARSLAEMARRKYLILAVALMAVSSSHFSACSPSRT